MSLVDTHAHLASSRLREDLDEVITRSREADLCRIITIACDLEDSVTNLELAERFDIVSPTVGIHPLYVHEIESDEWEKELRELGQRPGVCAIA
ncbi:MAG: TatD family hydrolase, partial [Verrucomicrobiales bacterium]